MSHIKVGKARFQNKEKDRFVQSSWVDQLKAKGMIKRVMPEIRIGKIGEERQLYQLELEKKYQEVKEEIRKDEVVIKFMENKILTEPSKRKDFVPRWEALKEKKEFLAFMEKERRKFGRPPPKLDNG